jgi:hypothetical protein
VERRRVLVLLGVLVLLLESELTGLKPLPGGVHETLVVHRPVAGLAGLDDRLDVAAEPRSGGSGVDDEPLGEPEPGRVGLVQGDQTHLLDVDLIPDDVREPFQRLRIRGHDGQLG